VNDQIIDNSNPTKNEKKKMKKKKAQTEQVDK